MELIWLITNTKQLTSKITVTYNKFMVSSTKKNNNHPHNEYND